jgi:hypothetical protein
VLLLLLLLSSALVVLLGLSVAVVGTVDDSAEAAEPFAVVTASATTIRGPVLVIASPRVYVTPIRSYTSWTMSKAGLGRDRRPADRLRDRNAVRTSDESYAVDAPFFWGRTPASRVGCRPRCAATSDGPDDPRPARPNVELFLTSSALLPDSGPSRSPSLKYRARLLSSERGDSIIATIAVFSASTTATVIVVATMIFATNERVYFVELAPISEEDASATREAWTGAIDTLQFRTRVLALKNDGTVSWVPCVR